jgi:16S rRNA (uracil1498-N3)-methyltransferase
VKTTNPDNHCFALFCKQLSQLISTCDQKISVLTDKVLVHRISIVLRMQINDRCILFDRDCNIECSILTINKKEIKVIIVRYEKNKVLNPFIRLYLPILKRNHLEDAILLAGQVGVSEIQLIITEKSAHTIAKGDRLERLMVGACEQAKQYVVPSIYQPIFLTDLLDRDTLERPFVCAQGGLSFSLFQKELNKDEKKEWSCSVFVGPEQDFTENEYKLFAQKNIPLISLGALVLQASVATCVSIALLRASFLEKNDLL